MLPFALVSAIECAANHRRLRIEHAALAVVPGGASDWRDVGGYGAATALGLATTQVDRWYLCLALPADRYGIYYLASSLMLSMFSLQVPVIRAFLPRMATAERPDAVARAMRQILLLVIAVPSLLLAAFAPTALNWWLHDAAIANAGAPAFRLLMLAVAMNAVFAPTSMLLLHGHRYREIAAINAAILVVQLLVLALLTPRIGMLAGACAWLAWSAIQLAYAGYHARTATER
jgi:O-antigen/teichoic acid export membrane protein